MEEVNSGEVYGCKAVNIFILKILTRNSSTHIKNDVSNCRRNVDSWPCLVWLPLGGSR